MNKLTVITFICLIKVMAATGTPSEVPTIESLGLRVSLVAQPADEQAIRARAANTILEIYHHLNRAENFLKEGNKPRIEGKLGYLPPTIPGGNWEVFMLNGFPILLPKRDHSTFCALSDIKTALAGTIYTECFGALIIAKISLSDCFYTDSLKDICKNIETTRVKLTVDYLFCEEEHTFKAGDSVKTGDSVCLPGHERYATIGTGPYQGENVFMIGFGEDGLRRYIGFGENFKTGPKTAKEIHQNLAEGYTSELKKQYL